MLRVLTYHRVVEQMEVAESNPSLVSSTRPVFDRQMRYLAARYRVVSPEEILDAVRDGKPLPKRAVLITFDDAYRDFGEIAWPILRRYRLPATLFVPTAYPDHPERAFWWDRLHLAFSRSSQVAVQGIPLGPLPLTTPEQRGDSLRRVQGYLKTIPHATAMALVDRLCTELGCQGGNLPQVLRWNELRELAREGVTLGAHTRTHPVLTQLGAREARVEIQGSREDLTRETGIAPRIFGYPFGSHSNSVVEVVEEEGFELAVTCVRGQNEFPFPDALRLRRTNVALQNSSLVFRLRLLTTVSCLDAWRHRRRLTRRDIAIESSLRQFPLVATGGRGYD